MDRKSYNLVCFFHACYAVLSFIGEGSFRLQVTKWPYRSEKVKPTFTVAMYYLSSSNECFGGLVMQPFLIVLIWFAWWMTQDKQICCQCHFANSCNSLQNLLWPIYLNSPNNFCSIIVLSSPFIVQQAIELQPLPPSPLFSTLADVSVSFMSVLHGYFYWLQLLLILLKLFSYCCYFI